MRRFGLFMWLAVGAAFLAGVLGWLLMTGVGHVVADHTKLHQMWDLEIQRAQQAQQGPLPTPLPETPPDTAAGGS